MKQRLFIAIITVSLVTSLVAPTAFADLTAQAVRQAINNGIAHLKREQAPDGSWGEFPGHPGGVSSMCLLALVNAGVSPQDPAVQKGLEYLRSIDRGKKTTYATSLMTMALANATPELDIAIIRENVSWLEQAQIREGRGTGGWAYGQGLSGRADNSNTQFALLALHEAALVGVEVDREVWVRARDYWVNQQHPSGGFGYVPGNMPSGSMTCAGISSLIIVEENLAAEGDLAGGKLQCCGQSQHSIALENAIRYWGTKFAARYNPTGPNDVGKHYLYYYLYGVERAGRLSGRRFFGDHDWYREGAEFILERQREVSGSWSGAGESAESQSVVATSFALLFLSKGRWPVAAAKYQYGESSQWDQNPKGLHYLIRATESSWNQKLTWQTVNGKLATVNDLLQSPVLVLSGSDSLVLTENQKKLLLEYITQGGFLFAWANESEGCDGSGFDRDFRELMEELFPNSPLTVLEASHPIWFADQPLTPSSDRPLLGVQACCRTSVVYCPRNLGCYWQYAHPVRILKLPATVRPDVDDAIQLGINVLAYATGRNLQDKLDRPQVAGTRLEDGRTRSHLELPKLSHGGGADEARSAWGNLLDATSQWLDQPISKQKQLITADDPRLANFPIVFMHGRRSFEFTPGERESLARFLSDEVGGFVMADAICGNREFAESFRKEFTQLIPDSRWERLPANHPLFSREFRGFDLAQVTLRRPERTAEGVASFRENRTAPLLEGLWVGDRLVVVFSPYDLSCALENGSSLECEGYAEEDARRIGINILLYALQM